MTDQYSTLLLAWVLLALIGGWVLVNALIDLGARRVRRWMAERWAALAAPLDRLPDRDRLGR